MRTAQGDSFRRHLHDLAAGAIGGAAATLAMSAVMLAGGAAGLMGTQPPRRVVDRAAEELDLRATGAGARDTAASVLHVAIGAVAGALFALGRSTTRFTRRPPNGPLLGAVWGLAFWALNYLALAPGLHILPPATRDRPGRPPVMIAAHLVYGVSTAVLTDRLLAGLRRR